MKYSEWLRSRSDYSRLPSSLFSAAEELASLRHPHRPTLSDSLEERIGKDKSSMVASAMPNICFSSPYTCLPTQCGREPFFLFFAKNKLTFLEEIQKLTEK
jgi:hypothetical protein